jgi:O-antigen/teichoic acid export membrane protein
MKKGSLGWFTFGSLASSSLSFISIPIIAWVFADADIGKIALLITVSGLGAIVFGLGLDQSYTREFHETPDKAVLLLNAAAPGLALFTLASGVLLTLQPTLLSWILFGERSLVLSMFVIAYLFIVLVSRFLALSHRMREDGKRYSLSFLLPKVTFVTLISMAYYKNDRGLLDLLAAHGASVTVGLLFLLATTRSQWSRMRPSLIDWQLLSKLLAFGVPMATSGMLFWGLEGVDKFMLRSLSSFSELGVYSIALSISAMANVATSMFTTIWVPVVYRWVANNEDLSRIDLVTRHILAGTVFLIGATGASSWLLEYVLPDQHSVVQHLIAACMLWPLFYALSETTGLGIAMTRSTRFGLLTAAFSLSVNVALNFVLLPRLGSSGAAVSLSVAIWVFLVLRTEISHRIWRQVPRRSLYTWTIAALALSVTHALLGPSMRFLMLAGWLGFLACASLAFRSSLMQVWTLAIVSLRQSRRQAS